MRSAWILLVLVQFLLVAMATALTGSLDGTSSIINGNIERMHSDLVKYDDTDLLTGKYGLAFIAMTDTNLKISGVDQWYEAWTITNRYNPDFITYGEIKYFGMAWLNDDNFECDVSHIGCNKIPEWSHVLQRYSDNPQLARRVYFASRKMYTTFLNFRIYLRSVENTHIYFHDIIAETVKTFTQQPDKLRSVQCDILKAMVTTVTTWSYDLVFWGITKGLEWHAAETLISASRRKELKDFPWPKSFFSAAAPGAVLTQSPVMGDAFEKDLCDAFGGMFDAHNEQHIASIQKASLNLLNNAKAGIIEVALAMGRGTFQEAGKASVLSQVMTTTGWSNATSSQLFWKDPRILEEPLKKGLNQFMVSGASTMSNCYLKCNRQANAQDLCDDTDWDMNKSRFCPEPEVVCQFGCWAGQYHGRELTWHGLDKLAGAPWHLNLQEEGRALLKRFKKLGNKRAASYFDLDLEDRRSLFVLPVCYSDAGYVEISAIHDGERNQDFPISCGDWRSNETGSFMKAMTLDTKAWRVQDGTVDHLYDSIMPWNMDNKITLPLDWFLAYCGLGLRFPQHTDGPGVMDVVPQARKKEHPVVNEVEFAPSPYCPTMVTLSNEKGQTHEEANIAFCTGEERGHLLAERNAIDTDAMHLSNSRQKCGRYIKDLADENPMKYKQYQEEIDEFRDAHSLERQFW